MARASRNLSPRKLVYIFWEGESEEAYAKYLSAQFSDRASIQVHREKGTFYTAQAYYRGNQKFHNDAAELDEIWFFFDTELEKGGQWAECMRCLETLQKGRGRKNPIRIRLLMTSCCIEYWLLLHYEQTAPAMATSADKLRIESRVRKQHMASYKKGDYDSIAAIARNYPTAVVNGKWVLGCLEADGMPQRTPEDTSASDEWLFRGSHTFTTVHEALEMLCALRPFKTVCRDTPPTI